MKTAARSQMLLLGAIWFVAPPVVAGTKPRIEALRTEEINSQCGCEFRRQGSTLNPAGVVFLQWDTDGNGSMRVDGKLIRIKACHAASKGMTAISTVGHSDTYRLEGDGLRVIVTATVHGICPKEDDSCEITTYKARVTVKSSTGASVVNGTGSCGC